jgi:hypothetical protein
MAPVMLKRGRLVTAHFAHYPESSCGLAAGESLRHIAMKAIIGKLFARERPEYEVPFKPNRRADIVLSGHIIVECQASAISIDEWDSRTFDYNELGYALLWIWDKRRLREQLTVADEYRIPAEIRYCHRQAYGRIYVLDGDELLACHLGEAEPRYNDFMGTSRIPYTLRIPEFVSPGMRLTRYRGVDGESLVHLDEGIFWKGVYRPARPRRTLGSLLRESATRP